MTGGEAVEPQSHKAMTPAAAQVGATLDLALIGNGRIALLVDAMASVVWGCFPQIDGDPVFCALLDARESGDERGIHSVELSDCVNATQSYVRNTAVLTTRLEDSRGGVVEIVDCIPRFVQHGRMYRPMLHVRQLKLVAGSPRITIRLRPAFGYGQVPAAPMRGRTIQKRVSVTSRFSMPEFPRISAVTSTSR